MKLLYRGAEADLLLGRWAGEEAVYKMRTPMPYRHPTLDASIRSQRTAHEAQMMRSARGAGVATPHVFYVDPGESLIVMEYVRGERLKAVLERSGPREVAAVSRSFGRAVAALHSKEIIHGDLTTANAMLVADEVAFLDFGLSFRSSKLEDRAVDLRLIKETLYGAHSEVAKTAFGALLDGYGSELGRGRLAETRRKLLEVERRGRYARVE